MYMQAALYDLDGTRRADAPEHGTEQVAGRWREEEEVDAGGGGPGQARREREGGGRLASALTMSSPFNPLTPLLVPGGTPFLPGFGLSPQASPGPTSGLGLGASPWFLGGGLGGGLGGSLGGGGLAPGIGSAPPSALSGLPAGMQGGLPGGLPGGLSGGAAAGLLGAPPTHTVPAGTDLDDALRALPEITRRLERAEALRAECAALEDKVFRGDESDPRIEGVQLECESVPDATFEGRSWGITAPEGNSADIADAQTLLELISLTGTYLVGALPLASPPIGPATPLADLAAWTEARAEAQFARREAVKDASKAVVEVLSKRD